jgi:DNA (cytosine-5)-methyltransferase 1
MIYRFGELFCGPGGLALGAINACIISPENEKFGVEHAFATDIDKWACKTYAHNICQGSSEHVYTGDIKTFDISKFPDIDAFAFGFPCNDFSIVGEHKGINGDFGGLYRYGKNVIDIKRPKWFIAENVGGLKSANGGETFDLILKELSKAGNGYELTPHLYKFEEYGIPQKRHRIIIVGIEKKEKIKFKVPAPTTRDNPISAQKAIEEPPINPKTATNNELTKQSKTVVERLSYIPEGKNAWCEEIPERLRLNVKRARLSQIYKRFKRDEPAYTITGSGGGGTHGYHWSENRALTNRERARLQTFPDSFFFVGGKEQVRKQIGMAVPPVGVQIIVEAVLKTFARVQYDFVQDHWAGILNHSETA